MAGKEMKIPFTKVKGKYNIIEHIDNFLGLIEIATSEDNYFKVYDLSQDNDMTQFEYLSKMSDDKPWVEGVECFAIMLKDEFINVIPRMG